MGLPLLPLLSLWRGEVGVVGPPGPRDDARDPATATAQHTSLSAGSYFIRTISLITYTDFG
jgi:hypothetical protein